MCGTKLTIATVAVAAACVHAQPAYTWEAFNLNVPDRHFSEATGISEIGPSGNVGILDIPEVIGAAVWHGGPGAWTPFREPDRVYGPSILGADAHTQGGWDDPVHWAEATLWFGSRRSRVNLHPGADHPNFLSSQVLDVSGTMAVGTVYDTQGGGRRRAMVWVAGNDPEFVVLAPHPSASSAAWATDGRWQGGHQFYEAVIWKGTPESRVVMNPPGYHSASIQGMAYVDGVGTQVGVGSTRLDSGRVREHALLWHDTPESYIVMHPSHVPEEWSVMRDTTGSIHCGVVDNEAGIWFGDDPDSFFSLHGFVPPQGRGPSEAYDVDVYNGVIYVVGMVTVNVNGQMHNHAYMWVGTPTGGLDGPGRSPIDRAGPGGAPTGPARGPARR